MAWRVSLTAKLLAAGTFRRGITDTFTAELHGETQVDGASALGLDTAWQVGDNGRRDGDGCGRDETTDDSGWLAGLGVESSGRRMHVFARTQLASERFGQVGQSVFEERPKQRSFAGVGFDLARFGSLQLAYGRQSFWESTSSRHSVSTYGPTLGSYGFLSLFLNHTRAEPPLGPMHSSAGPCRWAIAAASGPPSRTARRTRQPGQTPRGDGPAAAGTAGWLPHAAPPTRAPPAPRTRQARRPTRVARVRGSSSTRAAATPTAGAYRRLVDLHAHVGRRLPTPWAGPDFAVVQVADYPDLTVYVENQPIGRTDRRARVLLDRLRPYDTNQVSLDPAEIPPDASLSSPTSSRTPAYRSGAVVRFPITRATAATMRLVQEGGEPVPAGAQVHAPGGQPTVALDGLIFLTDAAGYNEASASWPGHRCRFSFQRPEDGDPTPDLGEVRCRAEHA